jgi:hypothetical protein
MIRFLFLCATTTLLLTGGAQATTTIPIFPKVQITHEGRLPSCRMTHARLKNQHRLARKTHTLLKKFERQGGLSAYDRLILRESLKRQLNSDSQVIRKVVQLHIIWDNADRWIQEGLFDKDLSRYGVSINMPGEKWYDAWGILPSHWISDWDEEQQILTMQSPVHYIDLCYSDGSGQIALVPERAPGQPALELHLNWSSLLDLLTQD